MTENTGRNGHDQDPDRPGTPEPGDLTGSQAVPEQPAPNWGAPGPRLSKEPPPYGSPEASEPAGGQFPPGQSPGPAPHGPPGGSSPYGPPGGQYPPGQPPYGPPGGSSPYGSAPYGPDGGRGATDGPVTAGAAFSYAWSKFTQNLGVLVGGTAIYALIYLLLVGPFAGATGVFAEGEASPWRLFGFSFGAMLASLVVGILAALGQAGITNVALRVVAGHRPTLGDFFTIPRFGPVALTAVLIGLANAVASRMFVLSLAVSFFAMFILYFALDRAQEPMAAVTSGVNLVTRNLSVSVVTFLVWLLISVVGLLACCVGLLAAVPLGQIMIAYVYRRLHGEHPAP